MTPQWPQPVCKETGRDTSSQVKLHELQENTDIQVNEIRKPKKNMRSWTDEEKLLKTKTEEILEFRNIMTDLKSSTENCDSKSNIVEKELANRKESYFKSYCQSNMKKKEKGATDH